MAVILLISWLLGLLTGVSLKGFIHVLLIIALIVIVIRLIQGRRVLQRRETQTAVSFAVPGGA